MCKHLVVETLTWKVMKDQLQKLLLSFRSQTCQGQSLVSSLEEVGMMILVVVLTETRALLFRVRGWISN